MACPDNCCTIRVSDIRPTDVEPVIVDAGLWLESVGATQLGSASWEAVPPAGATEDLVISDEYVDKGQNLARASVSGGDAGEMYTISVTLVSCEGYQTTICVQQYVLDCG